MTLSEKILHLRTAHGMSQGNLAEKLEVSRQSVSKWETGQSVPDLDKIIKLADLFGVTVDELVREGERPEPEPQLPPVVYVERRQASKLPPTQILGIILEILGVESALLGLVGNISGLILMGIFAIAFGLPLLLVKKHPWLLSGWLLVAGSWFILNPQTSFIPLGLVGGIRRLIVYVTTPAAQYRTNLFAICIALARGILTLILIYFTCRARINRGTDKGRQ